MTARTNPWVLSAPALVVYATFLVVPMALVFLISFFDFQFFITCCILLKKYVL